MNWFDLIILIIAIGAFARGLYSGLIMQLARLIGLILAAIFSGKLSAFIAPKLANITDASPHIISPLSYIISFIIIVAIIFIIGRLLQSTIKIMHLNTFNRIIGGFFCSISWLILSSICLNIIVEFDQKKDIIKEDTRKTACTYPYMIELGQTVVPYLKFDKLGKFNYFE